MEIIIQSDPEAGSQLAASLVARQIQAKADSVLGLATGGTPVLVYRELIKLYEQGKLDGRGLTTFNLDEYVGLPVGHPASYARFMEENLFNDWNVPAERIHIPDGAADDVPAHCQAYEEAIVAAGIAREHVERAVRLVDLNEYKRRQAPIGVRITQRGFGRDRRYPITCAWHMGD